MEPTADNTISLFIPCFIDQLFPETGMNMVKVLEKAGYQIHYPENQTCCGQPALTAGFPKEAKNIALKFLQDFKAENPIVAPSASCISFICNSYPKIFKTDKKLNQQIDYIHRNSFEFSDFLITFNQDIELNAKFKAKVVYHDSCSALNECDIKMAPRLLLKKIEGLELIEMEDCEACCGFGGSFAIKHPDLSEAMAQHKIDKAIETDAEYIVSTDWSCLMHLKGIIEKKKLKIKVMHLADILAKF